MRNFEAEQVKKVVTSGIRIFYDKATALMSKGIDVVDFTIGRPDFPTPSHICDSAKRALDLGQVHYTPNAGLIELRRAIAQKANDDGVEHYKPETEVIVTIGACEALAVAIGSFIGPEDEVLIPSPHWPVYVNLTLMNLGRPVFIPLKGKDGFQLDPSDVEGAITPKTKVLIINNPHNPTGTVLTPKNLHAIADLASSRDLLIIADEVYEKIIFDGARFTSFPSIKGMRERTIYINACSKTYSMTGWRIGWTCAPEPLASIMLKVHQQLVTCPASFAQAGAVKAIEGPQDSVAIMVAEFAKRRSVMLSELSTIPRISITAPMGTFYAFVDIRGLNRGSSNQVALQMIEEAHVAVVPGSSFGEAGEGYIRLSLCCNTERLLEGIKRIRAWLE